MSQFWNTLQLRMDSVGYVRLGKFWNSVILGGHYWRLYYNDDYGAGVYVGRRKVELKPDRIYLLPPNCDLETWCTGEPVQLYLHFEMTQLAGNPDYLCNELRISDDMKILISRLRPMLEFKEDNNRANVKLFAIALAANAMAMLPQEALSELNSDKRIASICDYLRENMRNDISIDQLAAPCKNGAQCLPAAVPRNHRKHAIPVSAPVALQLCVAVAGIARFLPLTEIAN